ncbi:MAG: hypothetical protein ACRC8S_14865 [Fimbriiglobus sp.]
MNAKLLGLGMLLLGLSTVSCNKPADTPKADDKKAEKVEKAAKKDDDHDHGEAPHGGTIIEFGKYHAEFCVDHGKKQVTVYILSEDLKKNEPIAAAKLLLSIKTPTFQTDLVPAPQEGDPKGKSSRFVATHDNFAKEQEFEGTVSGEIDGKPYLGDFKEEEHKDHKRDKEDKDKKKAMTPVDDHGRAVVAAPTGKEAAVYLTPGGIYTADDIKANGNTTVSVKYKDLKVSHDINPKAGDKLCPITLTKANAELTWVIAGKKYEFCCSPCVEEFVTLAKTKPDEVKAPETYIKK